MPTDLETYLAAVEERANNAQTAGKMANWSDLVDCVFDAATLARILVEVLNYMRPKVDDHARRHKGTWSCNCDTCITWRDANRIARAAMEKRHAK